MAHTMDPTAQPSRTLRFLMVARLAAAVAGSTAWRQGLAGTDSLNLGCTLALLKLGVFLALAGSGAGTMAATWGAVTLGIVAMLGLGPVPRRRPA